MGKAELLSPGGSLRKVKTALLYGADSVYVGTPDMSLRSKTDFSLDDLKYVSQLVKRNGKKVYLTLNLFAHNKDVEKLPYFVNMIKDINPDGLLIADPGIFAYFKKHAPEISLHISTQSNVCSWLSVQYWHDQGADLCVLAREVSFEELKEIREKCQGKIEAFVHGSMCMTYSGRCLLSNFMSERGANQGSCAHSCRWNYKIRVKLKSDQIFEIGLNEETKQLVDFYLEEEFRDGDYYQIEEDNMGSYIMNSKDLCLMPVLDQYLDLGVDTLKIEGRNKNEYYVAITAQAYRLAIDSWYNDTVNWSHKPFMQELYKIQNRGYTTAFHHGRLSNIAHNYDITKTLSEYTFAGIIVDYDGDDMIVELKHQLSYGDVLEFCSPFTLDIIRLRIYDLIDNATNEIKLRISPGRPNQAIRIPLRLFNLHDKQLVKEYLPILSVVRKEYLPDVFQLFLKRNKIAFAIENEQASQEALLAIDKKIKDQHHNFKVKSGTPSSVDASCCSKGCNGCLVFWHDPKYHRLREKLKHKQVGEKLIKHVDF